jgi:transcriptional regulator with XRE-family HTH domain
VINTRRVLTEEEKKDTDRLRTVWDERIKEESFTQKEASAAFGFKNQSAISQYLNGRIPLNLAVAAKFAKYLKVPLSHISPRYSAVTEHCSGEETLMKKLRDELVLTGKCNLTEMDDQAASVIGEGSWYVWDPSNKKLADGVFVVKTATGTSLIKFVHHRGSFRIYGTTDDPLEEVVLPAGAANLMTLEGKVLYKIDKV